MKTKKSNHNSHRSIQIAIIGGSYGGLTLANVLHLNSFSYTIFDRRCLPFTHVTGGSGFNIPSFSVIQDELSLPHLTCKPNRKDVIDLLMRRVKSNLLPEHHIVEIKEGERNFLYVVSESKCNSTSKRIRKRHGPYHIVVGADGVVSKCRNSAYKGILLIGDARWVNERWFDLGLRRIDRGANIAMVDGLQLGQVISRSATVAKSLQEMLWLVCDDTKRVNCAREKYQKKIMLLSALVVLLLAMMLKYLSST